MKNIKSKSVLFIFAFFILAAAVTPAFTQIAEQKPEFSVAGFRLGGDEETAKALLKDYSPRYDNELGKPKYFFYNGHGDQVMTITGYSREHPYLIVGIEVFSVGESYQKKHYQLKDKDSFMTESGFFIGQRPSFNSLMFAIPNRTAPNNVIAKKGKPESDEKNGKVRTLLYHLGTSKDLETPVTNEVNFNSYTAEYRFVKKNLTRFSISLDTNVPAVATNVK